MVDRTVYDIGDEYVRSIIPKEKPSLGVIDFLGFKSKGLRDIKT